MEFGSIELEIQRLLDQEATLDRAAKLLVQKISSAETADQERQIYWNFLFQAGFYEELLTTMIARLQQKGRIHWGLFIETLSKTGIEPSRSVIESTFKGMKRQSAFEDAWAAKSWDSWDSRFEEIRSAIKEQRLKEADERKSSLIEKFHFLKNQRMREQAGRVLKHLIFLYPEDPALQTLKFGFDEEWAREIISHRFSGPETPAENAVPAPSEEETGLLNSWRDATRDITVSNPSAAYDFAIGFQFVDAAEASLQLARSATGVGPDWLTAELMLKLKRYVDLLEFLKHLEEKYSGDPETAFAVAYLRAQALKALGQSAAAVELLRNIVQVRPDYRSVTHLIKEWSVGAAAV